VREILTGIFTWPWFSEPHGYNFNGHFIQQTGVNLCIDPVEGDDDLAALAQQGVHGEESKHQSRNRATRACA
jgi:hypothetical protein